MIPTAAAGITAGRFKWLKSAYQFPSTLSQRSPGWSGPGTLAAGSKLRFTNRAWLIAVTSNPAVVNGTVVAPPSGRGSGERIVGMQNADRPVWHPCPRR